LRCDDSFFRLLSAPACCAVSPLADTKQSSLNIIVIIRSRRDYFSLHTEAPAFAGPWADRAPLQYCRSCWTPHGRCYQNSDGPGPPYWSTGKHQCFLNAIFAIIGSKWDAFSFAACWWRNRKSASYEAAEVAAAEWAPLFIDIACAERFIEAIKGMHLWNSSDSTCSTLSWCKAMDTTRFVLVDQRWNESYKVHLYLSSLRGTKPITC